MLRRVATALKLGLDDDAIVWFEPQWDESGEKPHFVIFLPDHGIAVAEVLSVRAAKLLGVLRGRLRAERDGEEIDVEQPLARAERHAEILRDRISRSPRLLDRGLGVTPIAIFASLERESAGDKGLDQLAGLDLAGCLFREEIEAAVAGDGTVLHRWFAQTLGAASRSYDDLVDVVRSVVQPDLIISDQRADGQLSIFRATATGADVIRVMDRQQETLARSLGDGHRVVRGVAGSGKTLILVYRARRLAEAFPQHTFLLSCYNRSLASELRRSLPTIRMSSSRPFTFLSAARFATQDCSDPLFGSDDSGELRAAVGLEALEKGALTRYRAVFLDEAQDLRTQRPPVHHPSRGRALQRRPDRRGCRAERLPTGVQLEAGGRAGARSFENLRRNYRNTREVLELAHGFLVGEGVDESSLDFEDESVIVPPEAAMRTGAPATVVLCEEEELVARTLEVVHQALAETTAPKTVGVLTMSNRQAIDIERRLRVASIEHFFVTDPQKKENRDHVDEAIDPVILSTVYSAKGMEFATVVLVCTPRHGQEAEELRRSIYVGMTRATARLTVLAESSHPLAEDLKAAAARRGRLKVEADPSDAA